MKTKEMFYNQFLIGLAVFTCAMTVLLALDSNFKDAGLCVLVCSLASQLVIQRSKIYEMNKENKILRKWAYSSLKYDKKESTQPKRQAV